MTSISEWAFSDCNGLDVVNISDVVAWCEISFGGATANPLYYAQNLYVSRVTDLVIPDDADSIGSYAFYGCNNFTSVTIGDGMTSIGGYAFSGCTAQIAWGDDPQITK